MNIQSISINTYKVTVELTIYDLCEISNALLYEEESKNTVLYGRLHSEILTALALCSDGKIDDGTFARIAKYRECESGKECFVQIVEESEEE